MQSTLQDLEKEGNENNEALQVRGLPLAFLSRSLSLSLAHFLNLLPLRSSSFSLLASVSPLSSSVVTLVGRLLSVSFVTGPLIVSLVLGPRDVRRSLHHFQAGQARGICSLFLSFFEGAEGGERRTKRERERERCTPLKPSRRERERERESLSSPLTLLSPPDRERRATSV